MKSFADFISEATPRGKAIQRGKISKAEAQRRQAREDRKRAAQERRDDKAKAGIDALIGSDEERKVAAAARANPEVQRKKALKRTIADRMAKGAKDHGLDEERRETEIGITGGGKDSNMLYLNGIQNKKIKNDEIISEVVSLIEKKEAEILNKK